jgi:hypothetical protein
LDKHFWQPGLAPLSREKWVEVQRKLASQSRWIMDGTWVPTMPFQSVSPQQIRFCSSIFRCGCVCGARSDGARRIGTSGGGSSRGDGLSDQKSATYSPSIQTRVRVSACGPALPSATSAGRGS